MIAETIRDQLPRGIEAMIGVKQFVGGPNFLQFGFKAKAFDGINLCKITLNALDLYDVEFYKVRGCKYGQVGRQSYNIGAEDLGRTIEIATGLAVSL